MKDLRYPRIEDDAIQHCHNDLIGVWSERIPEQ